jgi:hypothetical protein
VYSNMCAVPVGAGDVARLTARGSTSRAAASSSCVMRRREALGGCSRRRRDCEIALYAMQCSQVLKQLLDPSLHPFSACVKIVPAGASGFRARRQA